MSGKLIVFEGTDGSGKATQTKLLCRYLEQYGIPYRKVDFPRYGQPSAAMVQEYLAGKRTSFSLPLSPCGTPFQQQVWEAVADIPYAQTATAADIACRIGHAGAHRAVGAAARACPFAIAVPLHRLVRANGQPWGEGKPARVRGALLKLEQSR